MQNEVVYTEDIKDFLSKIQEIDSRLNIKNYHNNGVYSVCLGDNYIDVAIPTDFASKDDWVIYINIPHIGGQVEITSKEGENTKVYTPFKIGQITEKDKTIKQVLEGSNIKIITESLPIHLKYDGTLSIRHNIKSPFGEIIPVNIENGTKYGDFVIRSKEYYIERVKQLINHYNTDMEYKAFIDGGRDYK